MEWRRVLENLCVILLHILTFNDSKLHYMLGLVQFCSLSAHFMFYILNITNTSIQLKCIKTSRLVILEIAIQKDNAM